VTSIPWSDPIRSFALRSFWDCYKALLEHVQKLADKQFHLFRQDPRHPSLGFSRKGEVWIVEVGRGYCALARQRGEDYSWIGSHKAYDKMLKRVK
jgi:hypothetical protein